MVHGTQGVVGALALGERARINGREVARVGLWGAGAYLVDGAPVGATEAAELTAGAAPVVVAAPEVPAPPATPRPAAPARRSRQARAKVAPAAPAPAPTSELLEDVRETLSQHRGLRFSLRTFPGGEAVVVTAAPGATLDAQRVFLRLASAGLHAERGHDGSSVVVAKNAKTLAP